MPIGNLGGTYPAPVPGHAQSTFLYLGIVPRKLSAVLSSVPHIINLPAHSEYNYRSSTGFGVTFFGPFFTSEQCRNVGSTSELYSVVYVQCVQE